MERTLFRKINLHRYKDENGCLSVIDRLDSTINFDIKRIFFVDAKKNSLRGEHSHLRCTQIIICISGMVEVTLCNPLEKDTILLDSKSYGLLIPPGIWSSQKYLQDDSSIAVICDQNYEESDYIRNWEEYLRRSNGV